MKFFIGSVSKFGDEEFRKKDSVVLLHLGTFGDFEKPYYHKVLCCEYVDDEGRHNYEILGEYSRGIKVRKYFLFGKILSVTLLGFKSKFKKEDVEELIESKEGEL